MRKLTRAWVPFLFLMGSVAGCVGDQGNSAPGEVLESSESSSSTPTPTPTRINEVLLFNGVGTNASNAQALIDILEQEGLSVKVMSSAQMEAIAESDLRRYLMIVWPGGDANVMSDGLSGATRAKIRRAVVQGGVSYVGFCAGAWMAVGPVPAVNSVPYWGLAIVPGDYLKIYLPNGQQPTGAMVTAYFANQSSRDLVWWGGPYLADYSNGVIARYPDRRAAIIETTVGSGFVVISGLHPEAPQNWRDSIGLVDRDGLDFDVAWDLLNAGLLRSRLATF